jgi:hypothetical protein
MKRFIPIILLFLFAIFLPLPMIAPAQGQYPTFTPTTYFPPPQYASGETFVLVSVSRANLRTAPSTTEGIVVGVAVYGERFKVVGIFYPGESIVHDVDSETFVFDEEDGESEVWFLVEANGGEAWIFGGVVLVSQPDGLPGIERTLTPEEQANLDQQLAEASNSVGVIASLNMHSSPSVDAPVVGTIPYGQRATVVGRNENGTWLYVSYNGVSGWVSVYYIIPPMNYNLNAVPIIR